MRNKKRKRKKKKKRDKKRKRETQRKRTRNIIKKEPGEYVVHTKRTKGNQKK